MREMKIARGQQPGSHKANKQSARLSYAILPAVLLFYSSLIPPEIFFDIGGLRVYGYRMCQFLLMPAIAYQIFQGRIRFSFADLFTLVSAAWISISYGVLHGVSTAIESGGALTSDVILAYLIGRISISTTSDFRRFLKLVLPGVVFSGVILMMESVSGTLFFRPTISAITGGTGESGFFFREEFRIGLLRAYGPFYHPIMAGLVVTSFLPLYYFGYRKSKARFAGIIASVFGVFCVSSSAFLSVLVNVIFFIYEQARKQVKELSWPLFLIVVAFLLAIIQVFSENGVIPVINRYLTLNPATGYSRMLIWQYAGAVSMENPLYGIGQSDYTRPTWMANGSVDAHFLLLALRNGMICAIAGFFPYIIAITRLGLAASPKIRPQERDMLLGFAFSISIILILLFTVAAVSSIQAYILTLLGMAISITDRRSKAKMLQDAQAAKRRGKGRRWQHSNSAAGAVPEPASDPASDSGPALVRGA